MKSKFLLSLIVCAGAVASPLLSFADVPNETNLIATLRSKTATPKEKADACADLKLIATPKAIPALAALLPDEKLSHSARYVLESIKGTKAESALIGGLSKTSGMLKVGIIQSLGVRAEPEAISRLGRLLDNKDQQVAVAAAVALGRIGGPKALKSLEHAANRTTNAVHAAVVDGLLNDANQMLDADEAADAFKTFKLVYENEKSPAPRIGAYRGMILSSGNGAVTMMSNGIVSNDPAAQSASLRLASTLDGKETTSILAGLLAHGSLSAPMQRSIIISLFQRRDPVALSAVFASVQSPDPTVRVEAITALGPLGDDTVVSLLADRAANGHGAEKNAARESLLELNRGQISSQMIAMIKTSTPEAKAELLHALGARGDKSVLPAMIDLALHGKPADHADSLVVLGQLAGAKEIPQLLQIVEAGVDEASRSDAADALTAVYQRLPAPTSIETAPLVLAVKNDSPETRVALLPVCSGVATADVRETLRTMTTDTNDTVRDAAIHALCETHDPELLPDLLKLAVTNRALAVRGCVRLTTQDEGVKLSNAQKLDALKQLLAAPLSTANKQAVLSGLGAVQDIQALPVALGMLADASVKTEAEQSVIQVASSVSTMHPFKAAEALKKVLDETTDPAVKKSAQTALDKIKPAAKP